MDNRECERYILWRVYQHTTYKKYISRGILSSHEGTAEGNTMVLRDITLLPYLRKKENSYATQRSDQK